MAIGRVERITALVAALLGIATGIGYFWDRLSPAPTLAYFDGTASTDASQLGDGNNTALRDFLAQQGNNPVFLDLSVYVNELSPRRTPACDTDPPAGMSAAADASSYVFWSLEPNHTCITGTGAQQPSAVLFALDLTLDQTIPGADVQIPPSSSGGVGRWVQRISGFFLVAHGSYGGQEVFTLTPTAVAQDLRQATRTAAAKR